MGEAPTNAPEPEVVRAAGKKPKIRKISKYLRFPPPVRIFWQPRLFSLCFGHKLNQRSSTHEEKQPGEGQDARRALSRAVPKPCGTCAAVRVQKVVQPRHHPAVRIFWQPPVVFAVFRTQTEPKIKHT
jgi:hypothetical protein